MYNPVRPAPREGRPARVLLLRWKRCCPQRWELPRPKRGSRNRSIRPPRKDAIRLTLAAASVRWATRCIPRAWASLLEISSRTLIPISWMAGKESYGHRPFLTGAPRSSFQPAFHVSFHSPASFLFSEFQPSPFMRRRGRERRRRRRHWRRRRCICPRRSARRKPR